VFHLIFADACYVLKKELDRLSFGWFLKRLKMIVVDRSEGRRSLMSLLTQAKAVAASGRPIVIFPEGTRSAPGVKGKYQKGVAALYKALDVPVYPVALNSGYFWGRRAFDKKKGAVEMVFLDPIAPGLEIDVFLDTLEGVIESACDRLPKG
jgi:1-acyl-sn-glycerol-3-phosphate acyltransferase